MGYVFNALCQCLSKSGVPPTCRPHVLLGHFKFGAKALIPLKFTPYDAKVHTCRLAAGTRKRSGKMRAFASSVLGGFVNLLFKFAGFKNFEGWAKNMIYYDWGLR